MEFDETFKALLLQNKENPETNILKLETPIPESYEDSMETFLEKFFVGDPFDIKPEDLEVVLMGSVKVKKLKSNRRPSTFLSILRFIELYRQLFKSINSDLNRLASCYRGILTKDSNDPKLTELKNKVLAEVFSAGRILKKWNPQLDQFYRKTILAMNNSLVDTDSTNGNKKGVINLRKTYSESYLNLTFKPHYEDLINFCIICIAYSSKLKKITTEYTAQAKIVLG
ncbi:MAG: hypothetical protein IPL26_17820 [Leptospiraceae bacterium]|nr:hypothetical protein [Leptospiraceae bacterium]